MNDTPRPISSEQITRSGDWLDLRERLAENAHDV